MEETFEEEEVLEEVFSEEDFAEEAFEEVEPVLVAILLFLSICNVMDICGHYKLSHR